MLHHRPEKLKENVRYADRRRDALPAESSTPAAGSRPVNRSWPGLFALIVQQMLTFLHWFPKQTPCNHSTELRGEKQNIHGDADREAVRSPASESAAKSG